MSAPFIGEIRMFTGSFAPSSWALCNGQILPISQNTALFSILGTAYGGDGRTNFALPDLRGRSPLAPGQGPGLSDYALGEVGGQETVALTATQMPAHNHPINAATGTGGVGTQVTPAGGILAIPGAARGLKAYNSSTAAPVAMNANALALAGGSSPHANIPPYLAVNFIIALVGIYPSRS